MTMKNLNVGRTQLLKIKAHWLQKQTEYIKRESKPKPKHRKATKPSIVSNGHCYATVADHNLDSDPEVRIDVTICNVWVCEAPNYFEQLKANENVENEAEDMVEANVEDVQVEVDVEVTSSNQTTADVVELR